MDKPWWRVSLHEENAAELTGTIRDVSFNIQAQRGKMKLTYLIWVHKEQDEQYQLCQENYQQDNEELSERGERALF